MISMCKGILIGLVCSNKIHDLGINKSGLCEDCYEPENEDKLDRYQQYKSIGLNHKQIKEVIAINT